VVEGPTELGPSRRSSRATPEMEASTSHRPMNGSSWSSALVPPLRQILRSWFTSRLTAPNYEIAVLPHRAIMSIPAGPGGLAESGFRAMTRLIQALSPSRRTFAVCAAAAAAAIGLAACSSSTSTSTTTSTTAAGSSVLQVLVTNDDGVAAPGIDAAVKALVALPNTKVTVVAPAANQSGTGGKTTSGTLTATSATTASGYPAKAVAGYPADTIVWAIDDKGISVHPDLVVSGINFGQNIGPLADLSGTVGAARAAVSRGIPALAVSQGLDNGLQPDFTQGAAQLTAWVTDHRTALLNHKSGTALPQGNLNVPTCANGNIRGPINAPAATSLTGIDVTAVNCSSTTTNPANDAEAFVEGFAVIAPLGTASGS
jgi:5'-nucleotidase